MASARLAIARAFDLLERAHGIGGRGSERLGWMEQRLTSLLHAIATERGTDTGLVVDALETDPKLLGEIADTLRVGETRFFRDPVQWRALESGILPGLRHERVRALSIGCSTGEEVWTLAMVLAQVCGGSGRGFRVVGVDRSEAALSVARDGKYPSESVAEVPAATRSRYFEPDSRGAVGVAAELRAHVTFSSRDVMSGLPPGQYEIVICKNLLIYFGQQARLQLLQNVFKALAPGGALIVARSEVSLVRAVGQPTRVVAPGVFVLAE
jgi:chemotaxis protein methyltransferase CheR